MKRAADITSSGNKTGLYFGSFNPIHIGHLAIAKYMVEFCKLSELWFVVSPQNPHKRKNDLLNDHHRLEMVKLAVERYNNLKVCDIEFSLPRPSYTIETLNALKNQHPEYDFRIVMGSDNLKNFHKWKSYEAIPENFEIIIYPRPGFVKPLSGLHKNIRVAQGAPLMEISSSFIRQAIREGKEISHFLPPGVWEYIKTKKLYY